MDRTDGNRPRDRPRQTGIDPFTCSRIILETSFFRSRGRSCFWCFSTWRTPTGSDYEIRILNNCAIFIILAVSYNLINGVTGQFSLEPNAFVAIGAYTSALLTLTPLEKEISFIIEPCIWPLSVITTPFIVSLVIAAAS